MGAPSDGARVVVALLAGRTAFGLSYILGVARDLPIFWYRPLERAFTFGPRPTGSLPMEWFGRGLASLGVAAVVIAATWVLAGRGPLAGPLRRRGFVTALAQAAGLALVVDFSYFAWVFLTQAVTPLAVPPGCSP